MASVVDALFAGDDPQNVPHALAVATLEEALAVPGHDVPVMCLRPVELVWSPGNAKLLDDAITAGIWLSVNTAEAAGDIARRAERLGKRADVQVMLDTGMCREGCDVKHFASTVAACLDKPALRLSGVGTHLTDGELADEPFSDDQTWLFHAALEQLGRPLPPRVLRHVANSGGTLTGHGTADHDGFDLVRCGLALHGIDPAAKADARLLPTARWVTPIHSIREVPAGATVGYGRSWRAEKATRIGLLPVGYADGYRRSLSDAGHVRVLDDTQDASPALCPVVGRVSMDYVTIDLTPAPWAKAGMTAVLLEDDASSTIGAEAIARQCGTIPYEILCGIGRRVHRTMVA